MLSVGNSKVSKLYLGDTERNKAYLGDTLVFDSTTTKPSRLPAGYTEVEYIQFDYASGINTGLKVIPSSTKIEIDMETVAPYSGNREAIVSNKYSRAGQASGYYYTLWIERYSETVIRSASNTSGNTITWVKTTSEITGKRLLLKYDGPSKKITIGDTAKTITTLNYSLKDYPLHLGLYSGGTIKSLPHKLYSAKIYTYSTTLSRDYVPCIDASGVVGLYDLIGSKFYANVNTGTFTAGPTV